MTKALAPLKTFAPAAFIGDATYSQELCDTVLGLALLYNDIKDAAAIVMILRNSAPSGPKRKNKEWGEYCGRDIHVWRHHISLAWELLEFIKDNLDVIESPVFALIVKQMSRDSRDAWGLLVAASTEKHLPGSIGKILVRLRNTLSFHYDSKEIGKGFQRHFFKDNVIIEPAFVSLGVTMEETRYYFADAAAQDSISALLGDVSKENLQNEIIKFLTSVNIAFSELIHKFIFKRRCAYSSTPDE